MSKKQVTTTGIFMEAIGLYFGNILQFLKYMTFPVLGQVAGLIIVFLLTYIYSSNLPFLLEKFTFLDNFSTLMFSVILVTLPGMILLLKAFWEYLVAYGAVNSMLDNMLKSGKLYDFNAHTELIKRRTIPYVGLWLLAGIFGVLAIIPILWVPACVLAVYFVLAFQVFTYEPQLSPIGCVRKSLILVKGHFAQTFALMISIGVLTYVFLPKIFEVVFGFIKLTEVFVKITIPLVSMFPLTELNNTLANAHIQPITAEVIAEFAVAVILSQIIIQYTLPLRALLWGLWYKHLNAGFSSESSDSAITSS